MTSLQKTIWNLAWLACLTGVAIANADEASALLDKARDAARSLDYSGTYVYQHGDNAQVLRVSHRVDGRNERNRVEVIDGPHREFIRINENLYCHLADGRTVQINRNATQRFFPAVVPEDTARLTSHYLPKLGGVEKVAGRDCQIVILEPRDNYRYTHAFWLDRETFLPLRSRTVDSRGMPVSVYAFSEISLGSKPDAALFDVPAIVKSGRAQAPAMPAAVESEWQVTPPPGYTVISEVQRSLPGRKNSVLHQIYSDGISTLSVFIEQVDATGVRMEGLSIGSTVNIYARRVGDFKATALGEVPASALLSTVNSIQRK